MHIKTTERELLIALAELERVRRARITAAGPSPSEPGGTNDGHSRRTFMRAAGALSLTLAAGYSPGASANPFAARVLIGLGRSRVGRFVGWAGQKGLESFIAWGFAKAADHLWGRYAVGETQLKRKVGDLLAKFQVTDPDHGFIREAVPSRQKFILTMTGAIEQLIAVGRTRQSPPQAPNDLSIGSMLVTAPTDPETGDPLGLVKVRCATNPNNPYFEIPTSVTLAYEGRSSFHPDWVQVFHPNWETTYPNANNGKYEVKPGPGFFYISAWNLRWFEESEDRALHHSGQWGTGSTAAPDACKPQTARDPCKK